MLYGAVHPHGTLTAYRRHTAATAEGSGRPAAWLDAPGDQDLTAHVDFTALEHAAAAGGLERLGFVDQTYFLLGLLPRHPLAAGEPSAAAVHQRLALKTLVLPGGLGSTMKAIAFGKHVGRPALAGFPREGRVT